MPCHDNYIGIESSTPSRSGLYVISLPGVEVNLLAGLTTSDQADYLAYWASVYKRAWDNLVSDVAEKLNDKFFVDTKLVTRETSEFDDSFNTGDSLAGVRLDFELPKYARLHVISAGVYSQADYDSPDLELFFHEQDQDGELLHSVSAEITEGRNTVNVDTDFEVDSLFIGYDPSSYSLRKTSNKHYQSNYLSFSKFECTFPCQFGIGGVRQINGGGLNVKYVIYCSIEKYVCENINIFKQALLWRIGNELIIDRRFGNTVNCFTAMTAERAMELTEFYTNSYLEKLKNSVEGNIHEDPYCFNCKNSVTHKTILP